jgi:hypothetical protein
MHKSKQAKLEKEDYKFVIRKIKSCLAVEEAFCVIDFQSTIDRLIEDGFVVKESGSSYKRTFRISGWA